MAKQKSLSFSFKIRGQQRNIPQEKTTMGNEFFDLTATYDTSVARSISVPIEVTLGKNDYVELTFTDSTTWFGNSDTLIELFPEVNFQSRSSEDMPELPLQVSSDDSSRSILSQLGLKLFKKFSKKAVDVGMIKIAESVQKKTLKDRSGLYQVDSNFDLQPIKSIDSTRPVLLFIHGTVSSTQGSFSELKTSATWQGIQKIYGNNILGFEHETLTKSPLQNALELLTVLPKNLNLHLISHSRGGLVGDLLVRFAENKEGFLNASMELLESEKREDDIQYIKSIQAILEKKSYTIERFVRVACPARGTSILGNRVDIFLNVLVNLVSISNPVLHPIMEGLKALISQAIETKNDPEVLPGLEAMNPESVFLKALNTVKIVEEERPTAFENKLTVISGSSALSLSLNGLKVLLTKFFFKWEKNDLVVDTASMYQGARRQDPVQFFLDDGNNVNHFNYFTNKKTQDALFIALIASTKQIPTFKEIDVENYAALDRGIFGLEGGKLGVVKASGKKPIVMLLPGIMGSFLEEKNRAIWINYFSFALGGLTKLKIENNDIDATGVIKTSYKDLAEYLSASFDVEVFPFDWRRPVAEAGSALNNRIIELMAFRQPIHVIAHSMGGLVIRDMAINYPQTWDMLNGQNTFRTILLGTPWMGSYRIANVLSGRDDIIKQLDKIDFVHSKSKLINMFAKFPGLLALLPIRAEDIDFSSRKEWEAFVTATGLHWEIPNNQLLSDFAAFKKNINDKLDTLNHQNIIYVAGKDEETVNGYKIENGQLSFSITPEGDQSVPWETGIPKHINRQTSLYYTNATHGGLSLKKYLFQGLKELLDKGSTSSNDFSRNPLPTIAPTRGGAKEKFNFDTSEKSIEAVLLGLGRETTADEINTPILKTSVTKGDMIYATYPVLMGHFANDGIYNAEIVANKYLDGKLSLQHSLNIYPGNIGTHSIFMSDNPMFKGCIVCGLGQAELLNAFQLSRTIENAVANYLLTLYKTKTDNNPIKSKIGLSSLIIGAGYGGMAIESSARAVLQGIVNANIKVLQLTGSEDHYVDEIEFIELFEDKAITCYYSLANLIKGNSDGMNLAWKDKKLRSRPGSRKRVLIDTNPDWWQRLSVIANDQDSGKQKQDDTDKVLSYFSSTNNAREEKKQLHHNLPLIETLLNEISIRKNWSAEKSKAIFELLIPTDFKETIRRNSPILWVLDKFTASFPWELLQTGLSTEKPLCVSAGMIRQLATGDYKATTPIKNFNALVVGDPYLDGFSKAGQLQGAEKEARTVYDKLKQVNELNVEDPLIRSNSDEILTALFKQDYKILHLAGHGLFNEKDPFQSGMLIGKLKGKDEPMFLTPQHINQLPSTPEFVFINCCFLGRINPYAEEFSINRFRLAANLGTQLIENGVKAVVVAGWEVDDRAALEFANVFYDCMLKGYNFGDAVLQARKEIFRKFPHSNTWGAFQCYGQQHYKFGLRRNRERYSRTYDIPQIAENDLDNLISKSEVSFYDSNDLLNELKDISDAIKKAGFNNPEVRQKEAQAYMELYEFEKAVSLYNDLFKTENASFDVKALENFQNISVNKEIARYLTLEKSTEKEVKAVTEKIEECITNLKNLLAIWTTGHRYALIASAYKRKAFVFGVDKKFQKEKLTAMETSANNYFEAFQRASSSYPYCNWINMETFIHKIKNQNWGETVSRNGKVYTLPTLVQINETLSKLEMESKQNEDSPGYWELTECLDILYCRYLLKPGDKTFKALKDTMEALWSVGGSKNKRQKQIINLKIHAQFAEFAGMVEVHKKITEFLKEL